MSIEVALEQSYWPADDSAPLREITLGGLLREVAARFPTAWLWLTRSPIRLNGGAGPTRSFSPRPKAPRAPSYVISRPATASRSARPIARNG